MGRGGRLGQGRAQGPDARAASGLLVPGARDLLGLASVLAHSGRRRSLCSGCCLCGCPSNGALLPQKAACASEPARVITARRPQELPCGGRPSGRREAQGCRARGCRSMHNFANSGTPAFRLPASHPPWPAPRDSPAAIRPPGPPCPGRGAEGVRVLEPPGEDEEVAILFCGNCVCACAFLFG